MRHLLYLTNTALLSIDSKTELKEQLGIDSMTLNIIVDDLEREFNVTIGNQLVTKESFLNAESIDILILNETTNQKA